MPTNDPITFDTPFVTMAELAAAAGTSRQHIFKEYKNKHIEGHKPGRRLLFEKSEAERYLRLRQAKLLELYTDAEDEPASPIAATAAAQYDAQRSSVAKKTHSKKVANFEKLYEERMFAFETTGAALKVILNNSPIEDFEKEGIRSTLYYLMRYMHIVFGCAAIGVFNDEDPGLDRLATRLGEHLKAYLDVLNFRNKDHYHFPYDQPVTLVARADATAESICCTDEREG